MNEGTNEQNENLDKGLELNINTFFMQLIITFGEKLIEHDCMWTLHCIEKLSTLVVC